MSRRARACPTCHYARRQIQIRITNLTSNKTRVAEIDMQTATRDICRQVLCRWLQAQTLPSRDSPGRGQASGGWQGATGSLCDQKKQIYVLLLHLRGTNSQKEKQSQECLPL